MVEKLKIFQKRLVTLLVIQVVTLLDKIHSYLV